MAINKGKGPSYIFEFKYKRNSKAREMTRVRVIKTLYERAVKQLNFYVSDDALSKISDLRRYVIMYVYGRFIIKEIYREQAHLIPAGISITVIYDTLYNTPES